MSRYIAVLIQWFIHRIKHNSIDTTSCLLLVCVYFLFSRFASIGTFSFDSECLLKCEVLVDLRLLFYQFVKLKRTNYVEKNSLWKHLSHAIDFSYLEFMSLIWWRSLEKHRGWGFHEMFANSINCCVEWKWKRNTHMQMPIKLVKCSVVKSSIA